MDLMQFVSENVVRTGDNLVINGCIEYDCDYMVMLLNDKNLDFVNEDIVKSIPVEDINEIEIIHMNNGEIADSILFSNYKNSPYIKSAYEVDMDVLIDDFVFDVIDQYDIDSFAKYEDANDVRDAMSFLFEDLSFLEVCAIEEQILKLTKEEVEDVNEKILEGFYYQERHVRPEY